MSLFSSIKNALIEEDAPPVQEKKVEKIQAATQASYVAPIQVSASSTSPAPTSSGKMKEVLSGELMKSLAGSPYLNFQNMNTKMKLKIADTSTRLSAISASMEVQGISKQSILDGANGAVSFLNNESNSFQLEINSDIQKLEQEFKAKTESIASLLDQKQNQIKTLSEEISNLQKDRSNTEVQMQEDKTRLEVSKIEFSGSLNSLLQEVRNDINEITIHLGV